MTKVQKVIKYIAIALAIFLLIQILSAVAVGIRIISGIHGLTNSDLTSKMEYYEIESEVHKLDIDVAAVNLDIKIGDEFAVETNSEQITYKQKDGKLLIEEKVHNWWRVNEVGSVIIYVPEEVTLENVKIDAGAGDVSIQVAELANVDIDMGVGELELAAKLKGNNEFDFGVGRAELELKGVPEDYKIRVDKAIGDATISDEHMESGTYYGNGETTIEIDGGIGDIAIDFAEIEDVQTVGIIPEFLTQNRWVHFDPIIAEGNVLSFGSDGTYTYHCECGEPIGNSDSYDSFLYNEKTKVITIYGVDEEVSNQEIKVLAEGKERILLYMDERVVEFVPYDEGYDPLKVYEECIDYFQESSSYETILKKEGNVLTTAPSFYDGDIKEHREMAREVLLADAVQYEYIEVNTIEKDGESNTTWEHSEMTEEDFELSLEGGSSSGFVWYNEAREVTKIVLYGELIVWE